MFEATQDGGPAWGFQVNSTSGATLAAPAERFSQRHRTYFLWDAADRVWVYSGDVGTFYWESGASGWQQHAWADGKVPAPPELTKLVPQLAAKP